MPSERVATAYASIRAETTDLSGDLSKAKSMVEAKVKEMDKAAKVTPTLDTKTLAAESKAAAAQVNAQLDNVQEVVVPVKTTGTGQAVRELTAVERVLGKGKTLQLETRGTQAAVHEITAVGHSLDHTSQSAQLAGNAVNNMVSQLGPAGASLGQFADTATQAFVNFTSGAGGAKGMLAELKGMLGSIGGLTSPSLVAKAQSAAGTAQAAGLGAEAAQSVGNVGLAAQATAAQTEALTALTSAEGSATAAGGALVGTLGAVAAAVGVVVAALAVSDDGFKPFMNTVKDIGSTFMDAIKPGIDAVVSALNPLGNILNDLMPALGTLVKINLGGIIFGFKALGVVLTGVAAGIHGFVNLLELIGRALETAGRAFIRFGEWVGDSVGKLVGAIPGLHSVLGVISDIAGTVGDAMGAVGGFIGNVAGAVSDFAGGQKDPLGNAKKSVEGLNKALADDQKAKDYAKAVNDLTLKLIAGKLTAQEVADAASTYGKKTDEVTDSIHKNVDATKEKTKADAEAAEAARQAIIAANDAISQQAMNDLLTQQAQGRAKVWEDTEQALKGVLTQAELAAAQLEAVKRALDDLTRDKLDLTEQTIALEKLIDSTKFVGTGKDGKFKKREAISFDVTIEAGRVNTQALIDGITTSLDAAKAAVTAHPGLNLADAFTWTTTDFIQNVTAPIKDPKMKQAIIDEFATLEESLNLTPVTIQATVDEASKAVIVGEIQDIQATLPTLAVTIQAIADQGHLDIAQAALEALKSGGPSAEGYVAKILAQFDGTNIQATLDALAPPQVKAGVALDATNLQAQADALPPVEIKGALTSSGQRLTEAEIIRTGGAVLEGATAAPTITIKVDAEAAKTELGTVKTLADDVNKTVTTTVAADTATAQTNVTNLTTGLDELDGKTAATKVTIDTDNVVGKLNDIKTKLDLLKDKNITVTTTQKTVVAKGAGGYEYALRHIATTPSHYAAGTQWMYGEPSTHGEYFISMDPAYAEYNKTLLQDAGKRLFGVEWSPTDDHMFHQFADSILRVGMNVNQGAGGGGGQHIGPLIHKLDEVTARLASLQREMAEQPPEIHVHTNAESPHAHGIKAYWTYRQRGRSG